MARHGGDRIDVVVGGDVTGQLAAGRGIRQIEVAATGGEGDQARLEALFARLRDQVADAAPEDVREAAAERVDELHAAVVAAEPDGATVRHVSRWLVRQLPQVAGAVAGVLGDPAVARALPGAGEALGEVGP